MTSLAALLSLTLGFYDLRSGRIDYALETTQGGTRMESGHATEAVALDEGVHRPSGVGAARSFAQYAHEAGGGAQVCGVGVRGLIEGTTIRKPQVKVSDRFAHDLSYTRLFYIGHANYNSL